MSDRGVNYWLSHEADELVEKLRLRDGVKASKKAVVEAAIRDKAKQRGFIDE